ncbi:hypothetical protein ALC53_08929 [Atta colombica]|uniref:Uncharacterized protein n=1 Tax=Atta colombica TaxID=520822 RepID=A0A151I1N0_9HYME|nr:hypothetical protein ALC53_08929 [Atta colombica]
MKNAQAEAQFRGQSQNRITTELYVYATRMPNDQRPYTPAVCNWKFKMWRARENCDRSTMQSIRAPFPNPNIFSVFICVGASAVVVQTAQKTNTIDIKSKLYGATCVLPVLQMSVFVAALPRAQWDVLLKGANETSNIYWYQTFHAARCRLQVALQTLAVIGIVDEWR